ncbi:MAG: cytochrome c [Acidobacteria bacterium]|nr:cytochrome c [Acidobacteriota bacterium]
MRAILVLLLLLTACNAPPPFQPASTLEEIMHGMVIPNAEVVWDSTGTIFTVGKTEEIQPRSEDGWIKVEAAATTLAEAGNALMMEGRAKDKTGWYERCRALIEAAVSVRKAAKARDVDALFTQGGVLFEACQACHFAYRFEADPKTIRTH